MSCFHIFGMIQAYSLRIHYVARMDESPKASLHQMREPSCMDSGHFTLHNIMNTALRCLSKPVGIRKQSAGRIKEDAGRKTTVLSCSESAAVYRKIGEQL